MEKTVELLTIRQTAKRGPLTEHRLRLLQKQNRLPGFYAGNRFLVNYLKFVELLDGGQL